MARDQSSWSAGAGRWALVQEESMSDEPNSEDEYENIVEQPPESDTVYQRVVVPVYHRNVKITNSIIKQVREENRRMPSERNAKKECCNETRKLVAEKLRGLNRYAVGGAYGDDGYTYDYADKSMYGRWVEWDDIEKLIDALIADEDELSGE